MARSAAQELQRPRRVCLPEKIRVPGRKRKPRRGARPVGGGLLAVHGHHEARAGVRVVVALPSEQALPNGTRVVWQRERRAEATRLAFARLAVVRLTRGAPAVAPARQCALHSRRMPKSVSYHRMFPHAVLRAVLCSTRSRKLPREGQCLASIPGASRRHSGGPGVNMTASMGDHQRAGRSGHLEILLIARKPEFQIFLSKAVAICSS